MLQMVKMAYNAQSELELLNSFPPSWETMEELAHVNDDWMQRWLLKRSNIARKHGLFALFSDYVDKMTRTDLPEYTDNPDVSPERKLKIVRTLHRTNLILGLYRQYIKVLTPLIKEVAAIRNRPVRLLELASGSGEMSMILARLASEQNLPVEVTRSDYVEGVVKDAEEKAAKRGLETHFRTINAFDMRALNQGEYDIIVIVGTMHHFTPGQLAVIMAQSGKVAGSSFVGIDGFRSMFTLVGLPAFHLMTLLPDNIHDAWLTSRKFYTLFELECIAQIAVPDAKIILKQSFPGISVLEVRF
jgi:2-polyprenyl-3-methyl-5-hydroxy-6-metoxy-1,4-benzoquinol methylase